MSWNASKLSHYLWHLHLLVLLCWRAHLEFTKWLLVNARVATWLQINFVDRSACLDVLHSSMLLTNHLWLRVLNLGRDLISLRLRSLVLDLMKLVVHRQLFLIRLLQSQKSWIVVLLHPGVHSEGQEIIRRSYSLGHHLHRSAVMVNKHHFLAGLRAVVACSVDQSLLKHLAVAERDHVVVVAIELGMVPLQG